MCPEYDFNLFKNISASSFGHKAFQKDPLITFVVVAKHRPRNQQTSRRINEHTHKHNLLVELLNRTCAQKHKLLSEVKLLLHSAIWPTTRMDYMIFFVTFISVASLWEKEMFARMFYIQSKAILWPSSMSAISMTTRKLNRIPISSLRPWHV